MQEVVCKWLESGKGDDPCHVPSFPFLSDR